MWISYTLTALVAALHVWFMVLEMFLWTSDATVAKFGMTKEFAEASAKMAANQGLYNLFLAAGLVYALVNYRADYFVSICTFFLSCVLVAGVFGGITVSRQIFLVQAVPAALALLAIWQSW